MKNIFEKLSLIHLDGKDSKLNSLIELIDEIEDKKIIIFSHYIETIKYLKSELEKKYRCEYILIILAIMQLSVTKRIVL